MSPALAITRRIRSTPWSSRIEAFGVKAYTVYNHMLLPTQIVGIEEDYLHLRTSVQVWDVACERQVEISGPDADRLAQLLTVRNLGPIVAGRCGYAPVVDRRGRLINDPVAVHVAGNRWWFSAADSDLVLWATGLAEGLGLDVSVHEPSIYPLAVQGPKSDVVMARIFGSEVEAIKFFGFAWLSFDGHPLLVARSGWSAQGGFEIYVDDEAVGQRLYDALMTTGEPEGIRPGCPNLIERIEAGLLTYGTDITRDDTALEAGFDRYCALDSTLTDIESIGIEALRRQRAEGVTRRICGLVIDGDHLSPIREFWSVQGNGGRPIGRVTSAAWSPRLDSNIAIGMLATDHTEIGSEVSVTVGDGCSEEQRSATVCALPFPGAAQR